MSGKDPAYGGGNQQFERGGYMHFRRKKKEILEEILQPDTYDVRVRPSGNVNDTSGSYIKS